MTKISFIGAGSSVFTRNLTRDVLTFPLTTDATLCLMDIDAERLEFARRAVQQTIDRGHYPARLEATQDRAKALEGADIVITTVNAQTVDVFRYDTEIPMQFGVDLNIADTRGPGGIFRYMRSAPVLLDIVRDMERICPKARLLNYTN